MNFPFFRKRRHQYPFKERVRRKWKNSLKCLALLVLPTLPTAGSTAFWYCVLYSKQRFFGERMEGIVTAAWIPTFGILYSILVGLIMATVWSEYKAMRAAVKRYDLDAFIDLCDEEISPLVHAMMFILSGSILLAFMSLPYPTWKCGMILVSTTSYLFCLIYMVVREIDDPCDGIWFIRSIPAEWLEIDIKAWRAKRCQETKKRYDKRLTANGVHLKPV